MNISEIMHRRVWVFKGEDLVEQALKIMNEKKINGAPVVDEDNHLIGMVVKADIYRFLSDPGHYQSYPLNRVISKEVITATKDEDIITVGKKLRNNNIVALPVVEDQRVIGLVSVEDIVDYFIDKYEQ